MEPARKLNPKGSVFKPLTIKKDAGATTASTASNNNAPSIDSKVLNRLQTVGWAHCRRTQL